MKRAGKAFEAANSMRIEGSVPSGETMIRLDLHLDRDGNCAGSVSVPGEGELEIIKRGKKLWVKPNAAYWEKHVGEEEGKAAAELFKDRYLYSAQRQGPFAEMGDVCELDAMRADGLGDLYGGLGSVSKGDQTDYQGEPVITIVEDTGERKPTTYWIAAEGEPYPLHVNGVENDEPLQVTFSEYNTPVSRRTPTESESVDVSALDLPGSETG